MHGEIEYTNGSNIQAFCSEITSTAQLLPNTTIRWNTFAVYNGTEGNVVYGYGEVTISGAQDSFYKNSTFSGTIYEPIQHSSGEYTTKGDCTLTLHCYSTGGDKTGFCYPSASVSRPIDAVSGKPYKEINGGSRTSRGWE